MKKIYTSIGLLFALTGTLSAQDAIEYNTFFKSGEFNFISEATNESISDGPNGEGVVWQFANLKEGDHAKNWFGEATEPVESMNPELFVASNLCLQAESGMSKFWKHDDMGLTYLGFETENTLLVLDDPLVTMPYPFVLGQKYSDTGSGTLHAACYDHSWDCEMISEVVGVGTLILPDATYEKAFKVKRTTVISSVSSRTGNERIHTNEEYIWFVNDIPGPVLEISYWNKDVCFGPTEGTTVNFSTLSRNTRVQGQGVFEMSVYPNPAKGETEVRIQSDMDKNATLQLRDVAGKVFSVETLAVSKGDTYQRIDLSDLNPGVYMVEIVLDNESASSQVVTQKIVVK